MCVSANVLMAALLLLSDSLLILTGPADKRAKKKHKLLFAVVEYVRIVFLLKALSL